MRDWLLVLGYGLFLQIQAIRILSIFYTWPCITTADYVSEIRLRITTIFWVGFHPDMMNNSTTLRVIPTLFLDQTTALKPG